MIGIYKYTILYLPTGIFHRRAVSALTTPIIPINPAPNSVIINAIMLLMSILRLEIWQIYFYFCLSIIHIIDNIITHITVNRL